MWNYQWLSCIVSICYFISMLASSDVQAWAWSSVRYPEIGLYLDIYIYIPGIVIYLCIVVYFTNAWLANRFSSKVPMRPRTSSSFIPSSITLIYSIPFISLLRDSGSHYVIICISKWRAQQDTQLHSTNSILSGGIFTNVELPKLFQLLSILISCDYENKSWTSSTYPILRLPLTMTVNWDRKLNIWAFFSWELISTLLEI